jgi:hypothetical protein
MQGTANDVMTSQPFDKELKTVHQETNTDHLDPAEFCRLLLSRRHLIRENTVGAAASAVVDPVSGQRYRVDVDRLDRFLERTAG